MPVAASPSLTLGPRLQVNRTVDGKRHDDRVGEDHLVAVEVVDDLLDVVAHLGRW